MERDYFKIRVSGDVRVALPLDSIDAALQIDRQLICPIPGVMPSLLGVINRQGVLTWVLDTSQFLELPSGRSPQRLNLAGQAVKALLLTRAHGSPDETRGMGNRQQGTDHLESVAEESVRKTPSADEGGFEPGRRRRANRQGQTVACVVSELEGVFTASRSRRVTQPLKPRLQPLLSQVVYDGRQGVAVLDPQALLDALQRHPLSWRRSNRGADLRRPHRS
ncbi:MAG: chemotaxis protein CheW [Phormidium sp. GEM2.Bin31]|nr:MAG: chemotaxis protein CheW [Phormidium sp. GEM2.Bin31]